MVDTLKLLALESTCDETAAAVIEAADDCAASRQPAAAGFLPPTVLSSVVASQDELHGPYGGVVPEIASRAHVENILPVIDEALRRAGVKLAELDAIAVATSPGLAGSLIVGLAAAKALCLATGKPLVAVDHLQAHVYACQMALAQPLFPCVGLIVSGGHSHLYHCRSAIDFLPLGGTIDDAAGEAFDKVASLLALPYPGGPNIERAAATGNPAAYALPRAFINQPARLQFSFSGLKTAVRYQLQPPGKPHPLPRYSETRAGLAETSPRLPPTARQIADLAASFQEAVVDCLVAKSLAALRHTGLKNLAVGGGVAANGRFRARLQAACDRASITLAIAPRNLCTDNAAMGAIALERLRAGLTEPLALDVQPGLVR